MGPVPCNWALAALALRRVAPDTAPPSRGLHPGWLLLPRWRIQHQRVEARHKHMTALLASALVPLPHTSFISPSTSDRRERSPCPDHEPRSPLPGSTCPSHSTAHLRVRSHCTPYQLTPRLPMQSDDRSISEHQLALPGTSHTMPRWERERGGLGHTRFVQCACGATGFGVLALSVAHPPPAVPRSSGSGFRLRLYGLRLDTLGNPLRSCACLDSDQQTR